jgi:hypothetical protein
MEILSIRERALLALCDLFSEMREDQPLGVDNFGNPSEYDLKWDVVQREPLGQEAKKKRYAMAILDEREEKLPQMQTFHVNLSVTIEFWMLLNRNEDPSTCANRLLLNIQRRLREDITLGGLVLNVEERANNLDVDSWADKQIEGAMFINVLYKHAQDDPRRIV